MQLNYFGLDLSDISNEPTLIKLLLGLRLLLGRLLATPIDP